MRVQSLGREDPWKRKWQSTPVFLPGKSHGERTLVGYSPWGLQSWTRLSMPHTSHGGWEAGVTDQGGGSEGPFLAPLLPPALAPSGSRPQALSLP